MLNFIPKKNKTYITWEYLLRVGSVFCLIVAGVGAVLIALFIPSAIFSKYTYNNINNQLTSTQTLYKQNGGQDPVAAVHDLNRLVPAYQSTSIASAAASVVVSHIIAIKGAGISITSFSISEGSTTDMVSISGTAQTRDDLTTFNNALKENPSFTDVTLPVADLIPDSHAQFSITFTYHAAQ